MNEQMSCHTSKFKTCSLILSLLNRLCFYTNSHLKNINDVPLFPFQHFLSLAPNASRFLTSGGEHDVVDPAIKSTDPLHCDLSVVDILGDEAGPVTNGLDGVFQQWVVPDKLKGLVRQVEGAANVLPSHVIGNALRRMKKKGNTIRKTSSLWFFKHCCSKNLQLRGAGRELRRCSAPTWCVTAPQWLSACTFPWRRRLPQPLCCRRTPPTGPRCPYRVTTQGKEVCIFHFPLSLIKE